MATVIQEFLSNKFLGTRRILQEHIKKSFPSFLYSFFTMLLEIPGENIVGQMDNFYNFRFAYVYFHYS